jgi:hypothetical protein
MATYKGTVNASDVSGSNLSDFPLYVDLTAIKTFTQAEADSIRVYTDAALTTELPREIVSTEAMHIKSSSLNGGDEYWVDFDGVRSDYASDATYGAQNVWTNGYEAVYHFQEDPTPLVNLITEPGAENHLTNWTQEIGSFNAAQKVNKLLPFTGNNFFQGGTGSDNIIYQDIDLLAVGYTQNELDNGVEFTFSGKRGQGYGLDRGEMILQFLDSSDTVLASTSTALEEISPSGVWDIRTISLTTPTNTATARIKLRAVLDSGSVANAAFDDLFFNETGKMRANIVDSTGNGNDGISHGAMTSADLVEGKLMGNAYDFDGSDDWIELPKSINLSDATWSASLWWSIDTLPSNNDDYYLFLLSHDRSDELLYVNNTGPNNIQAYNGTQLLSGAQASTNTWYKTLISYDNEAYTINVNGGQNTNTNNSYTFADKGNFLAIFKATSNRPQPDGKAQEVRISSVTRSADWESTEYKNQDDPGSFWTWEEVGTQQVKTRRIFNIS